MHRQKAFHLLWGVAMLCLVFSALPALASDETVRYFYERICDSCNPQEEFEQEFLDLTGESLDTYEYLAYDADTKAGMQALKEALSPFSVKESDIRYPMLIFGGRLYMGQDQILKDLPSYILKAGAPTESFFYYVNVTGCESCMHVEEMIKSLPETVKITRGEITFDSPVRVQKVNLLENPVLAAALFDAFHVEKGKQTAPILLAGDSYWQGEENISAFLKYSLPAGRAIHTPRVVLGAKASSPSPVLAGFMAGLYGCLSLFLLALLVRAVSANRPKKALAAYFIIAVSEIVFCCLMPIPGLDIFQSGSSLAVCTVWAVCYLAFALLFIGAGSKALKDEISTRDMICP